MIHGKYSRLAQLLAMCAFVSALVLYPPKAYAGQTIKIMTLNIGGYIDPDTNLDALSTYIINNNIDILALQEAKDSEEQAGKTRALFELVYGAFDAAKFQFKDVGSTQMAVMSKYPVTLAEVVGAENIRAQKVSVDISTLGIPGINALHIINVHPRGNNNSCPDLNGFDVYPLYDNIPSNQVVMGDFNMVFPYPFLEYDSDGDNVKEPFNFTECSKKFFPKFDNPTASSKYFGTCGGEEGYVGGALVGSKVCLPSKSLTGGTTDYMHSGFGQVVDNILVDARSPLKLVSSNIINEQFLRSQGYPIAVDDDEYWRENISDHYAVIATLEYLPNAQPPPPQPPAATSTPTPTVQQQAAGQNSGGGRGRAIGNDRNNDDYMYYCIFAICYFMLVHFGFSNGRKFRLGEIGLIILLGLGAVYAFGLMGGVFVLFLGSFLLFM